LDQKSRLAAGLALPRVFTLVQGIWGLIYGITLFGMAFRGGGWGAGIVGRAEFAYTPWTDVQVKIRSLSRRKPSQMVIASWIAPRYARNGHLRTEMGRFSLKSRRRK
jgi:hypothetical protein